MTRLFLGEPPKVPIPGLDGFSMYIGSNLQKSVVFIGYRDSSSETGFQCQGTGFLVAHENQGYLVTARHVAEPIGDAPFAIRVNQRGAAVPLDADMVHWTYHPDPTVDLAVLPFGLRADLGFDQLYLPSTTFLVPEKFDSEGVGVGALSYVLGLFQYVYGKAQNMPISHAGNLALIPPKGEKIPVWDKVRRQIDWVEAYLIESGAIDGASGSPVFVRPTITSGEVTTDQGDKVKLSYAEAGLRVLGLLQGAWFAPPDSPLGKAVSAGMNTIVPVGVGIVVPAYKLLELLEGEELSKVREQAASANAASQAAVQTTVDKVEPATDNPSHKEDFMRLLGAASKAKPPAS